MYLFEEEQSKIKTNSIKPKINITVILSVIIGILVLITIIIYCLLIYVKGNIVTIKINGSEQKELKTILNIGDTDIKVPIKAISKYLGYQEHSGNYKTLTADDEMSYVQNDNQVTMFTANSNKIQQIQLRDKEEEEIELDEAIVKENGEFYTNIEGAKKIFNIYFKYDLKTKNVDIITLDALYNDYMNYYIEKYEYVQFEETFQNKKAVLDDIIIIKTNNEKYGAIKISNKLEIILEPQYDNIEYIPNLSYFLVSGNGKKGIISNDRTTIISIEYSNIKKIENKGKNYFLVTKTNGQMGLMDETGKIILYPEYNQIGYNTRNFINNDIKNEYVFFEKIIPIKKENLWALYDIDGKKITDFEFAALGSMAKSINVESVIQIPDFEILVIQSSKGKYDLITSEGRKLFGYILDTVYKSVDSGVTHYYMTAEGKTFEIEEYLLENGINKVEK